jgi:homospermidine synthase
MLLCTFLWHRTTDEKHFPFDGCKHGYGDDAAIYLNRPGCATKVRTWTPTEGPFHGFLITHNEAISIADYFTVREGEEVVYRPTVHYAYVHPSLLLADVSLPTIK